MVNKIKVYIAASCGPCEQIESLIRDGKVDFDGEVELIDVETEQGFDIFEREVLSHSDSAIPSAYKNGKECKLLIGDDGQILFNCPTHDQASDQSD